MPDSEIQRQGCSSRMKNDIIDVVEACMGAIALDQIDLQFEEQCGSMCRSEVTDIGEIMTKDF